jgi:Holliday junction resolvase
MPERELQELMRKTATLQGWHYFHVWNSRHSPSGFPDVVAIRQERLIAAELKRAGQDPTPAQTRWLEAFRQVQVIETYVWRPRDLDHVLEVLR